MPGRKNKKSHSHLPTKQYTGILDVSRSGMGFVKVEGLDRDILIHAENLSNALSGDTVKVNIIKEGKSRTEGAIESVLNRKQTEFSGR
ncbi:MAG: ribonuclease R, partial [Chitinophagaceae bacterium]